MKIAFLGTSAFAVPALKALAEAGHDVAAVYTRAPKPAGRGKQLQMSPVHARAETLGIPIDMANEKPLNLWRMREMQSFIRALLAGEDVVVINSCAVTSEAVRQTRQAIRRARRADEQYRRFGGLERPQEIEREAELMWARLRRRIVEGDHEVGLGCRLQPPFHRRPGLQIVGQRDRAEIATKGRTDFGGCRQHCGDAGLDTDVERTPRRLSGFNCLKDLATWL